MDEEGRRILKLEIQQLLNSYCQVVFCVFGQVFCVRSFMFLWREVGSNELAESESTVRLQVKSTCPVAGITPILPV